MNRYLLAAAVGGLVTGMCFLVAGMEPDHATLAALMAFWGLLSATKPTKGE